MINQVITPFPTAPDAQTDTSQEFSNKADAFVYHQGTTFEPEINQFATEANTLKTEMNQIKTDINAIQATLPQGTIDDTKVTKTNTWSASKIATMPQTPGHNVLINGNMTINQRNFTGNWVVGGYAHDRWKADASGMHQVVEEGSYVPNATYVLSTKDRTIGITTSPSSGNWITPTIPRGSREVKLELGTLPTAYVPRAYAEELALCQRYYQVYDKHVYLFMYTPDGSKKQVSLARTVTMHHTPIETVSLNGGGDYDTSYSDASCFHYRAKNLDPDKSAWLRHITCSAEL